jgi:hypothetical protein
MPLLVLGLLTALGALFAYRRVRPMTRRRKDFDAGAVSEAWLQQQRGEPKDY